MIRRNGKQNRELVYGVNAVEAALETAPEKIVSAFIIKGREDDKRISRIVSLGSIMVAALFPVVTLIYWLVCGANVPTVIFNTLCCVIMATMVIWLHRSNIERLKNGTEYRFGSKK